MLVSLFGRFVQKSGGESILECSLEVFFGSFELPEESFKGISFIVDS